MYSRNHRKVRISFALVDAVLILTAFLLAYWVRQASPLSRTFYLDPAVRALLVTASISSWVLFAFWLGNYERLGAVSWPQAVRDTTRQCLLGGIALVLVAYLARLDLSRSFVGVFVLLTWILLSVAHANAQYLVAWARQEFGAIHFIALVGPPERTDRLREILAGTLGPQARIVGAYTQGEASRLLGAHLREQIMDEVIFAVEPADLAALEDLFLLCEQEGVRTRIAVDVFPHVHSDVFLDRLGPLPLLTFSAAPHDEIRLLIKRAADFVLAAAALLVILPLLLLVALAVRLTSPGPAIFRQIRCGINGRRFTCYKFRSMVVDAEARKAALAHLNEKQTAFKITNDPRLTPIGRWLRKFSIDELPQLWNVVRGDMSLVGPRPAVPDEIDRYERWQRRRLRMRPGLTCLWVINGRDRLDFDSWMKMDLQYIDNWSLILDLEILIKTVPQVLLGRGAN